MAAYSTSKAAVIGMVKSVGKEYAETNLTINALAPAVIRTGREREREGGRERGRERERKREREKGRGREKREKKE